MDVFQVFFQIGAGLGLGLLLFGYVPKMILDRRVKR
jgi:hypothetical protein